MDQTSSNEHENWKARAACSGRTNLMYREDFKGVIIAKAICGTCSVKQLCLQEAILRREEHGVWGGHDPRERRRLLILWDLGGRRIDVSHSSTTGTSDGLSTDF